jgi:hypothetical protein
LIFSGSLVVEAEVNHLKITRKIIQHDSAISVKSGNMQYDMQFPYCGKASENYQFSPKNIDQSLTEF